MGLITASGAADEKKAKGTQAPTCAPSCAAGFECVDGGCQGANHPKDKAFQGKLHMDTKCAYGALDCNVCVDDVRARFNQIRDGFDTDAKAYSFKWHDPCMKNPSSACFAANTGGAWHFQSIMRFADSKTDGSWLAVTRSVENGEGRVGVIRMGDFKGSPFPWRGQTPQAGENKLVAWERVGQLQNGVLNHASGAQMLGKFLFTGVECFENSACADKKAIVRIVDLSNPESPVEKAFIALNRGAADAAAARLDDGYLLMVHSEDGDDRLVFYRSDKLETGWNRIGVWRSEWVKDVDHNFGCEWQSYQNMSLVTQCDGKVFFVGLCRDGLATDWADLYRIDGFADHDKLDVAVPEITKVAAKKLGAAHGASFDYGGGVYVGPDHRMSFYAIEATTEADDASVYINEFAAKRK